MRQPRLFASQGVRNCVAVLAAGQVAPHLKPHAWEVMPHASAIGQGECPTPTALISYPKIQQPVGGAGRGPSEIGIAE